MKWEQIKAQLALLLLVPVVGLCTWLLSNQLADVKRSTDQIPGLQTSIAVLSRQSENDAKQAERLAAQVNRLSDDVAQVNGRVSKLEGSVIVSWPISKQHRAQAASP